MTATQYADPVEPAQRRRARTLGLAVGGGILALVAFFVVFFSINGLPKDPKEWKRMQERRAAAEAEATANQPTIPDSPAPKDLSR